MDKVVIFAGPSAFGLHSTLPLSSSIEWRPPVRRGDISDLLSSSTQRGILAIVDGIFRKHPAVSHRELLQAIEDGWQVWGLSSMGAIRAYEMRFLGMRGFGDVYNEFFLHPDFTDDELAHLHEPEPPYRPVSEALVNIRYAVRTDPLTMALEPETSAEIIDRLKQMYFGDRTLPELERIIRTVGRLSVSDAELFTGRLEHNRLKTIDLRRFLQERPWLCSNKSALMQELDSRI